MNKIFDTEIRKALRAYLLPRFLSFVVKRGRVIFFSSM
jgi:hypothetical protein